MLGGRTGSTLGLRTRSELWLGEERMVALETRCWGRGELRDQWEKQTGITSLREKHIGHIQPDKDNSLFEESSGTP